MAGKTSKSQEGYYSKYKTARTWEKNRKAKLERTIKEQPKNENAAIALKGMVYRRRTPTNKVWSASWIRIAKIFKTFEGRFDQNLMSANVELVRTALAKQSKVSAEVLRCKKTKEPYDFRKAFSLGERLQGIK